LTSSSNVSIDGIRMIQVLRMIQARVLEELGRVSFQSPRFFVFAPPISTVRSL
jgi:hypothetical protein